MKNSTLENREFVRFSILLYILILSTSCSNSEPGTITQSLPQQTEESPQETPKEQPEPTSIVIDSTDLKNLPKDTGGEHIAYTFGSTKAVFGHYIYTPSGYTNDGPEYPLLIFLHGWDPSGYTGSDEEELNELLVGGTPPGLINTNMWKPSFPFIVASPRLKSTLFWPHYQIHDFIEFLIDNYQINTKRIYLTGLSLGGGGTWYYVGERGLDNYVAAIVPISARGEERIIDNLTNIPIWAFHGGRDNTVLAFENYGSVPLVQAINSKNPKIKAKVTVFKNLGHNAWDRAYRNQFIEINVLHDPFDVSIYDWMLQYKKE